MEEDRLKQFGEIKVSDIMVPDPLFTTPDEKISTTELLMLRKKINGLPVVNNEKNRKVIGIITRRDIRLARFAFSLDSTYTTVKDLMTAEPIVISGKETLKEVLVKFFTFNIERLPVVNEIGELTGELNKHNILTKLLEYLK